ncbi:hypothetical protein M8J76_002106 [Diaphorina citri]|nr:hypothetical protein M8J76_002106 [Diaphorina citri]
MEINFIPKYLIMSEEQKDQDLKAITETADKFIKKVQKKEQEHDDLLDQMIENYRLSSDEMKTLQLESIRIHDIKENLTRELTELELTVKDVREEITTRKTQCEQIQQEIQTKSDMLNNYRINSIVEQVKSKYNYNKSKVKLLSHLFKCDLSLVDEASHVYNFVLKNDYGNEEVFVKFQTDENFPSSPNFQLLDIKSSPAMEPDLFETIQDTFHKFQDTQGLLAFLHKMYIK